MQIREEYIELFEAYNAQTMDGNDLLSFEARLASDSDFKSQFESYKQLEKGINSYFQEETKSRLSALDAELDRELEKSEQTIPTVEQNQPKSLLRRLWIPAAAACAVVFILLNLGENSNQKLAEEHWIKDPGLPVKMSSKGIYDQAMNHYKLGQWNNCLTELEIIKSDTSYYYQGQTHYHLKEFIQGLFALDKVDSTSVFYEKSLYSRAIILLSVDQKEEAVNLLKSLSKGNSVTSRKATQLLSEI